MKLRQHQFSIRPRIFEGSTYSHPWYQYVAAEDNKKLNRPNPPSKEAVERAKFVDKTYQWKGGDDNIRSGDKRSTQ